MKGPVVTGTGPWAFAVCGPVTTNIKNNMNANEHSRLSVVGVILFLWGLDVLLETTWLTPLVPTLVNSEIRRFPASIIPCRNVFAVDNAASQTHFLCFFTGHWTIEKICTGGFTDAKYFIGMVNNECFSNRTSNVYPSEPSSKRA
jgi:hypothetical protein